MNTDNQQNPAWRWSTYPDGLSLQQAAVTTVLQCAREAISQRGSFHLVLARGETPRKIYERLATATAQWAAWHVYFGDERCLPAEAPGRNASMAFSAWLRKSPIPEDQIHVIPSELGPIRAASDYAALLRSVGEFDLVLLGLGEDGHTASLFPGRDWGVRNTAPDALAVFGAPKPPPERVSMSARRLSRTRTAIFLVSGEYKRDAVRRLRANADIPAAAITPPKGVEIYVEPPHILNDDSPSSIAQ